MLYARMKKTTISDAEIIVFALQDEIRRSHEARYDHQLHAILLVAQGLSCRKVAQLLGDSPRAVAYWAKRFEDEGLAGLADAERPGRPRRLQPDQLNQIDAALRNSPSDYGLSVNLWKHITILIKQPKDRLSKSNVQPVERNKYLKGGLCSSLLRFCITVMVGRFNIALGFR